MNKNISDPFLFVKKKKKKENGTVILTFDERDSH